MRPSPSSLGRPQHLLSPFSVHGGVLDIDRSRCSHPPLVTIYLPTWIPAALPAYYFSFYCLLYLGYSPVHPYPIYLTPIPIYYIYITISYLLPSVATLVLD